jgi:hypothetical protein
MQYAADPVRGFPPQRQCANRITIELDTPIDELLYVSNAVFYQHSYRSFVAQPVAGGHRVGEVFLWRIFRSNGRGDTALCQTSIAVSRIGLGKDQHATMRREIKCSAETGNATADDEKVGLNVQSAILPLA